MSDSQSPDHSTMPDLNTGALAPVSVETTLAELPVSGKLPAGLTGALLRNGPNPFSGKFTGTDVIDWWPEAAMLHALEFSPTGTVSYRNRWARTSGWAEYNQQPVAVFPATNPNVNVIGFGGEILALAEGGAPVAITRQLQPVADSALQAAFAEGVTAHPKLDPAAGELRSFRAHWEAPFLTYQVHDTAGALLHRCELDVPEPSMLHDMAITENYSLLIDTNVAYDFQLFAKGMRIPLCWQAQRSSRIAIISREGGNVNWVTVDDCFVQHTINAFEVDSNTIVLDVMRYPHYFVLNTNSDGYEPNPLAVPWRYTIELAEGRVSEAPLCTDRNLAMELPRINESMTGQPYRYAWAVLQPSTEEMRGIARLDTHSGQWSAHEIPPGDQNSEPVFVPDPARESEDGGWLLVCVYRKKSDTTDLLVLDAADVAAAPLATVQLPVRIPAGFHGAWIDPPT